jgi:glucosyl-dolichyl phosphate glucuronosyltransferase
MNVTVVIPTYNRCVSVLRTLDCLRRQKTSADIEWEIVVVNNNSRDDTQAKVDELANEFPVTLRQVVEMRQGASNARNRGIAEARGDIVLFTDDDVRPDSAWVESVASTFQAHRCDAVVGRIELEWTFPRPQWVTDDLLGFLARLDYGNEEIPVTSDAMPPYGPNMAFRKKVFDLLGGFDPNLGRNEGSLATGEEPELFGRFLKAGLKAVYQPRSLVYHELQSSRMNKSFFRKSHFFNGVNAGREYEQKQAKKVFGIPVFVFPQFARSIGAFLSNMRRNGFQRSLRKEITVWYFVGFMLGCARHWHESSRPAV